MRHLGAKLLKLQKPLLSNADYRAALGLLAGLPTAELERLLIETVDVRSRRFRVGGKSHRDIPAAAQLRLCLQRADGRDLRSAHSELNNFLQRLL